MFIFSTSKLQTSSSSSTTSHPSHPSPSLPYTNVCCTFNHFFVYRKSHKGARRGWGARLVARHPPLFWLRYSPYGGPFHVWKPFSYFFLNGGAFLLRFSPYGRSFQYVGASLLRFFLKGAFLLLFSPCGGPFWGLPPTPYKNFCGRPSTSVCIVPYYNIVVYFISFVSLQ